MAFNCTALILAAGRSKRMGRPKQLLDFDGCYLLERVLKHTLSFPFSEVLVVIGHEAERIRNLIQIDDRRLRWIVNPKYAEGQSTSLKAGLEERGNHENIMVFLGDMPLIMDETIRAVMEMGLKQVDESTNQPFSVQPVYQGKPGHPVFFCNISQIDFSMMSGDEGAKNVLKTINTRIMLNQEDPGIIMDIDTLEEYEKALAVWSK